MKKSLFLFAFLGLTIYITACKEETKSTPIPNDGSMSIPKTTKGKDASGCILEPTAGMMSARLREPIDSLRQRLPSGFALKPIVVITGDGDLPAYKLDTYNGESAVLYTMITKSKKEIVHLIEYKGTYCKTAAGIGVGSTLSQVQVAYPTVKVQGSELEGRTTADAGGFMLLFDGTNFSPVLDQKTLDPNMKVKAILLQ